MEFKVGDWARSRLYPEKLMLVSQIEEDGTIDALRMYKGPTFSLCPYTPGALGPGPATPTEAEIAEFDAALAARGLARLERGKQDNEQLRVMLSRALPHVNARWHVLKLRADPREVDDRDEVAKLGREIDKALGEA